MNIIDAIAHRIRGNWRQGSFGGWQTGGPVCLRGGLWAVMEEFTHAEFERANEALNAEIDAMGFASFVAFNDDDETTEADVLLVCKRASARYDELTSEAVDAAS